MGAPDRRLLPKPQNFDQLFPGRFLKHGLLRGDTTVTISAVDREVLEGERGDEETTRKFMDKVAALPSDRLDDHIVQNCGRARVKTHLEEISEDPEFFMGADPNRVASYIATVHFSKKSGSRQDADNSIGGSLGDALRKAGLR